MTKKALMDSIGGRRQTCLSLVIRYSALPLLSVMPQGQNKFRWCGGIEYLCIAIPKSLKRLNLFLYVILAIYRYRIKSIFSVRFLLLL